MSQYLLRFDSTATNQVSSPDFNRNDATWELEIVFADFSGRTSGAIRLLSRAGSTGTFLEVNDPTGAAVSELRVAYRVNFTFAFNNLSVATGSAFQIGDGTQVKLNIVYDGANYVVSINDSTPTTVAGTNLGFNLFNLMSMTSVDFYSLKYWADNTRTSLIHNYDPSASNGTGTTLFDTQSNNNGTLVNFDVPACWVLIPSAGVTADGNFTIPALTLTGAASATLPAFTANGDFTLPALTLSGTASASLPQPIATGDFALPSLTLSGVASATLPQPQITGAFTMPALSISGVVHVTQPNFSIVGNFTMPALTMSGEASATQPQPSIVGDFTLPVISVSGQASATLPNPVAVGEFTLPALTLNGSASATEPVFTINGNFTLPALTLSGQASATLPQPIANGSFTLPAIQISGVAIIGELVIISTSENTIYEPRLSNVIYEPRLSNIIRG